MIALKKRMEGLIAEGGVITVLNMGRGFPELTLAGALWLDNPTRLRWCAIFPEHQGHIHELEYDKVAFDNGERDILFWKDGELVAGVVPYIEVASLPAADVREALAEWQALVAYGDNAEQFADFLANA